VVPRDTIELSQRKPAMLSLPTELLLDIAKAVSGSPRVRNCVLCQLSLVCKHLKPIAREVLLLEPALHLFHVPSLVSQLLKHPKSFVK
jgi:hypothetical protein